MDESYPRAFTLKSVRPRQTHVTHTRSFREESLPADLFSEDEAQARQGAQRLFVDQTGPSRRWSEDEPQGAKKMTFSSPARRAGRIPDLDATEAQRYPSDYRDDGYSEDDASQSSTSSGRRSFERERQDLKEIWSRRQRLPALAKDSEDDARRINEKQQDLALETITDIQSPSRSLRSVLDALESRKYIRSMQGEEDSNQGRSLRIPPSSRHVTSRRSRGQSEVGSSEKKLVPGGQLAESAEEDYEAMRRKRREERDRLIRQRIQEKRLMQQESTSGISTEHQSPRKGLSGTPKAATHGLEEDLHRMHRISRPPSATSVAAFAAQVSPSKRGIKWRDMVTAMGASVGPSQDEDKGHRDQPSFRIGRRQSSPARPDHDSRNGSRTKASINSPYGSPSLHAHQSGNHGSSLASIPTTLSPSGSGEISLRSQTAPQLDAIENVSEGGHAGQLEVRSGHSARSNTIAAQNDRGRKSVRFRSVPESIDSDKSSQSGLSDQAEPQRRAEFSTKRQSDSPSIGGEDHAPHVVEEQAATPQLHQRAVSPSSPDKLSARRGNVQSSASPSLWVASPLKVFPGAFPPGTFGTPLPSSARAQPYGSPSFSRHILRPHSRTSIRAEQQEPQARTKDYFTKHDQSSGAGKVADGRKGELEQVVPPPSYSSVARAFKQSGSPKRRSREISAGSSSAEDAAGFDAINDRSQTGTVQMGYDTDAEAADPRESTPPPESFSHRRSPSASLTGGPSMSAAALQLDGVNIIGSPDASAKNSRSSTPEPSEQSAAPLKASTGADDSLRLTFDQVISSLQYRRKSDSRANIVPVTKTEDAAAAEDQASELAHPADDHRLQSDLDLLAQRLAALRPHQTKQGNLEIELDATNEAETQRLAQATQRLKEELDQLIPSTSSSSLSSSSTLSDASERDHAIPSNKKVSWRTMTIAATLQAAMIWLCLSMASQGANHLYRSAYYDAFYPHIYDQPESVPLTNFGFLPSSMPGLATSFWRLLTTSIQVFLTALHPDATTSPFLNLLNLASADRRSSDFYHDFANVGLVPI